MLALLASCYINAQSVFNAKENYLNITPKDILNIKFKIDHCNWAKKDWVKIKKVADATAKDTSTIVLPLRGGNWPHYYVDPVDGKPLVTGKYLGNWHWEHHNQAGTRTYFGVDSVISKDYDGVVILKLHNAWANKLFALTLAYRINGNKSYLKKANEILSAYNRIYTRIVPHDKVGGHDYDYGTGVGRVGAQALDESVWLVKMLQGISLIWNDMTLAQRNDVEKGLLFPAAKMIMRCHNLGIQNISNWYNAAVGMTGYLTKNDSLINWALNEKGRGLKYQLAEGFTQDGLWYEGSPSYHFYALTPIILLAETAKNNGNALFIGDIQKVLEGPLKLMMPDMNLPSFNDCRKVYLPNLSSYYEYGYARFKNKAYIPILHKGRQLNEGKSKTENNFGFFDWQFLYGVPFLPTMFNPPTFKSLHLVHSGIDILYSDKGRNPIWLAAQYDVNNPSKGWHTHPDALNFVLYANGERISMDPGTAEYGAASHVGWDKTTIAHNCLVINQKNQAFKSPKSISFGNNHGVAYSFCSTDSAYQGVSQTRAYIIADSTTVLIADWIAADSVSTMDITYHQNGVWNHKEKGAAWNVPHVIGYKYLKDAQIVAPNIRHTFSTMIHGKNILIQLLASKPVSLITSIGIGQDFVPTPCTIARYKGRRLFLLWVIRLDGKQHNIRYAMLDKSVTPKVQIFMGKKNITIDQTGHIILNAINATHK